MKECSSCVMYECKSGDTKYGCPEDFFTECAAHTNIVNFLKRHNYDDLKYVQSNGVTYISCGSRGKNCFPMKLSMGLKNELKGKTSVDICLEAGKPCTENPTDPAPITSTPATSEPSSQSSTFKPRTSTTNVDPPGTSSPLAPDVSAEPIATAFSTSVPAAPAPTPSSVSNNQNGALKFIGILAFGWIIFSTAWLY
uniref:Uncharacterized protein n=1 Tax=Panagrolaimus davidi TaxID=227884 RepID=A0A914QFV8_9BILA